MRETPVITPRLKASMLRADLGCLADQIRRLEVGGIDGLHFDAEDDGDHKVVFLGPAFVKALRPYTAVPFEVHIRHADQERLIDAFVDAGANCVLLQLELCAAPDTSLRHIRSRGVQAGLAVYPDTPAERVAPLADRCDAITVMTVSPGKPGTLVEEGLVTLRAVAALVKGRHQVSVQADGAVSRDTRSRLLEAGADALVVGYPIFSRPDFGAAIDELRRGTAGV